VEKGVTFVIQGPLSDDTLKAIDNCKKLGGVVVSCWNTDSGYLIDRVKDRDVKLVVNTLEEVGYNFQNIKYQIQTTLSGLTFCKTPFTIKIRSDEYFTSLKKFVSSIYLNPDKLTVSNFIFRGDSLFHPSDHIVGGRTEAIKNMLKSSLSFIKGYKKDERVSIERVGLPKKYSFKYLTAETTFCLSYLKNKGIDVIQDVRDMDVSELYEYQRKVLKNNYSLVRASELGNFLFRFKSNPTLGGPTAFTSEEEFLNYSIKSIQSLEEL